MTCVDRLHDVMFVLNTQRAYYTVHVYVHVHVHVRVHV